ncbi:MAG: TonB-dependent receptor [Ignavibacteria bacterium]|nr:TonB-dependent receptor [Ignavibacteria bacterium]
MRLFNHFFLALLLVFTVAAVNLYSQTTGKIAGVVRDDKGELLIGARVEVEGTQLRSGTDENGQYAILNVPVGTYSVKCTYVGYDSQVQSGIGVSVGITSTVDFSLSTGGVVLDTTVIIAKRKTIDNGSGKIIGSEFIENTGIRGIENIVAKTSGVVQDEKGQNINIRGGRTGETQIIIDGIVTNNPLDRTSTANVSNGALQELAVLTGGFSAEYGNVLSGVINVTTRSAQTNYSGSVELVSDVIAGDYIKTKSQGYNIYSVSLGGPVIPTKKLSKYWSVYGSYEKTFNLVDQPVTTSVAELWSEDGILPNFSRSGQSYTGKTIISIDEMTKGKLKMTLTAGFFGNDETSRLWTGSFGKYNSYHNPLVKDKNTQGYVKLNQLFGSKTFYDLQASYLESSYKRGDGQFFIGEEIPSLPGEDGYLYPSILAYGDTNTVPGISSMGGTVNSAANFRVFRSPGTVSGQVTLKNTQALSFNLNVTHQILTKKLGSHELKFGGEYKQFKVRNYTANVIGFGSIANPNKYTNVSPGGVINYPVITENDANANFMDAYGYDVFGNEIEEDYYVDGLNITEGPKKPRIGAFYLQDKMEFNYFNTNIGVRVDYMDPNTLVPIDYRDLKGADGQLNEADYQKVEKTFEVSPRLGFSFPITDKTIFHAQYGKFIQLPALENLYTNQRVLRDLANGGVGYFTVFNNPLLKPEKTTAYELGVKHTAGDYVTVGVTAYYKETSDLVQAKNIKAYDNSYSFAIYDNGDFGIVRGVDLSLDLRRINRLRASISYGLSFSSGTGSDVNSQSNIAYNGDETPKIPSALDYDQRHTGSIELDYRWGVSDVPKGFWGGVLSKLGINALFSFNSGRPYTPSDNSRDPLAVVSSVGGNRPIAPLNSAYSPWNIRLDMKIDKTFKIFDKLNANLYLLAINVLDQELISDVFATSGEPGSTGWLDSYPGKLWAQQNGSEAVNLYEIRSHSINNYGPPRQVRLGFRLFFN